MKITKQAACIIYSIFFAFNCMPSLTYWVKYTPTKLTYEKHNHRNAAEISLYLRDEDVPRNYEVIGYGYVPSTAAGVTMEEAVKILQEDA